MSKAKSTKTETKRSAPVQSLDNRQHPIVGTAMLALLKDVVETRNRLDAHPTQEVPDGYDCDLWLIAKATALVSPSTPEEALAQACLIYDGADSGTALSNEDIRRIAQRAIGLAAWIETRFGIDRKQFNLDWFCGAQNERDLLPASPAHPYSTTGVAPLRAGYDERLQTHHI